MKKIILFLVGVSVASAAVAQSNEAAGTHFFVQPTITLAGPGSDFENAFGLGATAGVSFRSRHSVELEFVQFETEPDEGYAPFELDFRHILATYKYRIPLSPKFSGYVGGSIGVASQKAKASPGFVIVGDDSDDVVTGGVVGGVQYRFDEQIFVDGGVKVLGQGATRFTTDGTIVLVQISARFQF